MYFLISKLLLIGVLLQKHKSTLVVLKTTKRRQRCDSHWKAIP